MIKIKNRQEKTTGQKTLLDLKHQGSMGGCLLADSQIELSKSLSQKGDVARVCTNPGGPFMQRRATWTPSMAEFLISPGKTAPLGK
jgi:hypothetical protein